MPHPGSLPWFASQRAVRNASSTTPPRSPALPRPCRLQRPSQPLGRDHLFLRRPFEKCLLPLRLRAEVPTVSACAIVAAHRGRKLAVREGTHPGRRSASRRLELPPNRRFPPGSPQKLFTWLSTGPERLFTPCSWFAGDKSIGPRAAPHDRESSTTQKGTEKPSSVQAAWPRKQARESRYLTLGRRFNTYRPVFLLGTAQSRILFHVKHVTSLGDAPLMQVALTSDGIPSWSPEPAWSVVNPQSYPQQYPPLFPPVLPQNAERTTRLRRR